MLRELSDKHHGNQAERELQEKEREVENIARELERARRVANELNAKKGKLEAERDAYSVYVTVLFACVLVD
jgi:chromosome segregation ATPase